MSKLTDSDPTWLAGREAVLPGCSLTDNPYAGDPDEKPVAVIWERGFNNQEPTAGEWVRKGMHDIAPSGYYDD